MELFNNMVTALLKLIHCIVCFTFKQCIHSFFINNLLTQEKQAQLEWFPRLRCMSLDSDEPEQEQNEIKDLQMQLSETTSLAKTLSQQLGELRDKVNSSTHL